MLSRTTGVRTKRRCAYCLGPFVPGRADHWLCCGSCRQATSAAVAVEAAADVTPGWARRDTVASDRRAATGFGGMTGREGYRGDLRVRAWRLGELVSRVQLEAVAEWTDPAEVFDGAILEAAVQRFGAPVDAGRGVAWCAAETLETFRRTSLVGLETEEVRSDS